MVLEELIIFERHWQTPRLNLWQFVRFPSTILGEGVNKAVSVFEVVLGAKMTSTLLCFFKMVWYDIIRRHDMMTWQYDDIMTS